VSSVCVWDKQTENMEEHLIKHHGLISSEDNALWSRSMRCSTICGICEFEARKLSILEGHLEIKNMKKKTLRGQDHQKTEHYCEKCEKKFFLSKDIIYVYKKQNSSLTECDSSLLPLMTTKLA
jgi:hypothetical protein